LAEGFKKKRAMEEEDPQDLLEEEDDREEGEEEWDDWEDDEEESRNICLFCPSNFNGAKETLEHCQKEHGFDLVSLKREWGKTFF
jgi:hypothetical protein